MVRIQNNMHILKFPTPPLFWLNFLLVHTINELKFQKNNWFSCTYSDFFFEPDPTTSTLLLLTLTTYQQLLVYIINGKKSFFKTQWKL